MNIALIGGIDRLEQHYIEEGIRAGIDVRVFNSTEPNIGVKLRQSDAVVIFTNKVSHRVKKQAVSAARANASRSFCIIRVASVRPSFV